jgi:hypothetical protein
MDLKGVDAAGSPIETAMVYCTVQGMTYLATSWCITHHCSVLLSTASVIHYAASMLGTHVVPAASCEKAHTTLLLYSSKNLSYCTARVLLWSLSADLLSAMPQKASAGCLAWSGVHAALEGKKFAQVYHFYTKVLCSAASGCHGVVS